MKIAVLSISLTGLCLLSSSAFPQGTASQNLADRSWGVSAYRSLAEIPPTKESIRNFIFGELNGDDTDAINVCSSAFVDLAGTGQYDLVASIDHTGRMFCNDVAVFSKTDSGIEIQRVSAWGAAKVSSLIQRFDTTGRNYLVIPESFSQYQGAKCVATIDKVYTLQAGRLVDSSASYPAYYRNRLAMLKGEIGTHADGTGHELQTNGGRQDRANAWSIRFCGVSTGARME